MIGRLLSHLIGTVGSDGECEDPSEQLTEQEEGGWIIVNLAGDGSLETENGPIGPPDPLEQMLMDHPSRSVYQRCGLNEEEEEPLGTGEDICR